MRPFIKKLTALGATTTGIMTIDGYRRTVKADNQNSLLDKAAQEIEKSAEKMEQLSNKLETRQDLLNSFHVNFTAAEDRINAQHTNIAEARKLWSKIQADGPLNAHLEQAHRIEMEKMYEDIIKEYRNLGSDAERIFNNIAKNLPDSNDSNQFVSDYLERFQTFLNSLSTVEQGALASILFSLTVYYCVTGIATLYYGDKLIVYFKLEEKYPKVARWIKYRRTAQHFSIGFYLAILLFIAGYYAYANTMILLGK